MIVASANYAELYKGISNFRVTVENFYYNVDFANRTLTMQMNLKLIHNSSFSGFSLHSVILRFYYNDVSEPLTQGTISFERKPLPPYSNITVNYEVKVNAQTEQIAKEFIDNYQQGEEIYWTFSSIVRVFIFQNDFPTDINPPPFSFSK